MFMENSLYTSELFLDKYLNEARFFLVISPSLMHFSVWLLKQRISVESILAFRQQRVDILQAKLKRALPFGEQKNLPPSTKSWYFSLIL